MLLTSENFTPEEPHGPGALHRSAPLCSGARSSARVLAGPSRVCRPRRCRSVVDFGGLDARRICDRRRHPVAGRRPARRVVQRRRSWAEWRRCDRRIPAGCDRRRPHRTGFRTARWRQHADGQHAADKAFAQRAARGPQLPQLRSRLPRPAPAAMDLRDGRLGAGSTARLGPLRRPDDLPVVLPGVEQQRSNVQAPDVTDAAVSRRPGEDDYHRWAGRRLHRSRGVGHHR